MVVMLGYTVERVLRRVNQRKTVVSNLGKGRGGVMSCARG